MYLIVYSNLSWIEFGGGDLFFTNKCMLPPAQEANTKLSCLWRAIMFVERYVGEY